MSDPANAGTGWSRYRRVKQILDNAAGSACPSYQGRERFWNLPLPEFLEVVIYGVRMIAPAMPAPLQRPAALTMLPVAPATGSCCHSDPAPNADVTTTRCRQAEGAAEHRVPE